LDNKNAKIEKEDIEIIDFKTRNFKVEGNLDFRGVEAGSVNVEKVLEIKNKSKEFTISDITFDISITKDMEFHTAEEIKGWFTFSPEKIDSLGPNTEREVTVLLNVPLKTRIPENLKEEPVDGEVIVSSTIGIRNINIDLEIEPLDIDLELSGLDDGYTIRKQDGEYPVKKDNLTVSNDSEVTIELISLLSECQGVSHSWITLSETDSFDLEPEGKKGITMTISVPRTETTKITFCSIILSYFNPQTNEMNNDEIGFDVDVQE